MKIRSPEYIILKYFAKWQQNRHRSEWLANKYVQQVLTAGEIDKAKLMALFAERGIMTPEQFEGALARLPDSLFDKNSLRATQQGLSRFESVRRAHAADIHAIVEAAQKRPIGNRLPTASDFSVLEDKEY